MKFLLFFVLPYLGVTMGNSLIVSSVERLIDLSTQLVKMNYKMSLTNDGKETVKAFTVSVDPNLQKTVSFIGATTGSLHDKTYLRVNQGGLEGRSQEIGWEISLKTPLKTGQSVSVDVDFILGKALEMYPSEIMQKEKQFARFKGNHYVYLPYRVKTQSSKITFPSSNVESYSKLKPVSFSSSDFILSYGPYSNVEAFSVNEMILHYENNNPFLSITHLHRLIELSLWGNIAVEETVDIKHDGAKLRGSFSRYEFQRENSGVSSVKSFKTFLPAAALDVYYRDDVGNISTSFLRVRDDSVEVELQPRFPLFGGWKTHYTLGYNVPSYEYLYIKGNNFVLNMRLLDHVFNDMLVEDFEVTIILPEGVNIGKIHLPYSMKREGDSLHYTYLDTMGRPVITMKNTHNLVEKHIQDFQIEFTFSKFFMIREPLLLVAAFLLFFIFAMVYVRLDFSITKDENIEARMKLAGYCEKVNLLQDKRFKCYSAFDDALIKFKSNKDVVAFQNNTKKIASDHKSETSFMTDLLSTIKNVAPDVGDKISELQRLDKTYREHQTNQSGLVEKLVSGKLNKQQFIDQESVILKKKDETMDKINSIVRTL